MRFLLTIILSICVIGLQARSYRPGTLDELDRTIDSSEIYVKQRQAKINRLKGNLRAVVGNTDRYLTCKQIAECYIKFDSDSALYYFKQCEKQGVNAKNLLWQQEALIYQAFVLADRGDFMRALVILNKVGPIETVPPELKPKYAKAAMMRVLTYISLPKYTGNADSAYQQAWHTYQPYLDRNDVYYELFRFEQLDAKERHAEIDMLRQRLNRVSPYSYDAAILELMWAFTLYGNGDKLGALPHFIRSAIADIHNSNHSSSSIIYVANIMLEAGKDAGRVNRYLSVGIDNVARYSDVGRSIDLLHLMQKSSTDFLARYNRRMLALEIGLGVVAVAFIILMVWSRRRMRRSTQALKQVSSQVDRLSHMRVENRQLAESNRHLSGQVESLTQRLLRLKMLPAQTLMIAGAMVNNLQKTKKTLGQLIVAKSYTQAHRLATSQLLKDDTADRVHSAFDKMMLMLYPDFPERFNALLKPEARVAVSNGKLTPEMRIYALIALGVTDSVTIAEVLQYSPQTIYNYRLRARRATLQPNFPLSDYVASMYADKRQSPEQQEK